MSLNTVSRIPSFFKICQKMSDNCIAMHRKSNRFDICILQELTPRFLLEDF